MRNHWLFVAFFTVAPLARGADGLHAEYLDEWRVPSTQIMQLAEAVPAEKYAWRPAPGVRSISEVYLHIALGNFLLLDIAGVKAPAGLYPPLPEKGRSEAMVHRNVELETSITDKRRVIELLKQSFSGVHDNFEKADEATLNRSTDFFGEKVSVRAVYLRILAHNNEHMGQSIAYARMNGIVPPWSK
jgi:uncharacterized damage-inducible protein DinB